jgi:glutathione-regulated potassium-efflux system ancillary protein KefC
VQETFAIATLWLALAVGSTILANHIRISIALVEICVGVAAGAIATRFFGPGSLGANTDWLRFIAAAGSVMLTFLAGAELEPSVMRRKLGEVTVIGLVGFFAPFCGCAAVARFLLHWDVRASLLAGVALSTTSMAVVYAVMLETGFNKTEFGKGILGACFVNDLGTVLALGFIFAPFTVKTAVFAVVAAVTLGSLPFLTRRLAKRYAYRTAAVRTKWVALVVFGLGALAYWSGSEAVLPAYLVGMVLAGSESMDHDFIRRLRTLTVGFLTPFYFIRAGSLVSVPALIAAPLVLLVLLGGKVVTKVFGLYPVIARFRSENKERWYYTLMMSTGLTFGTISALYGFSHGIVSEAQYSFLVAAVIGSAVVPTAVATIAFLPRHLLPDVDALGQPTQARGDVRLIPDAEEEEPD